jgi:uncharacterized protein
MEQQSNGIKAFATRSPFFFALVFFVVSICLSLVILFVVPGEAFVDPVVQSLLAIGLLVWLGRLRVAGFNSPSQWRSLHLLWLPGLLALFYLYVIFHIQVSGALVVILAALFALLNGLNEEARFRGVILQALLSYGWLRATVLSALFFSLAHLTNLLVYPPLIAFGEIAGAFLFGLGYAACRLRTNTIWPLIILHACGNMISYLTLLNGRTVPVIISNSLFVIAQFVFWILLGGYGLFLLRPRRQPARQLETPI